MGAGGALSPRGDPGHGRDWKDPAGGQIGTDGGAEFRASLLAELAQRATAKRVADRRHRIPVGPATYPASIRVGAHYLSPAVIANRPLPAGARQFRNPV